MAKRKKQSVGKKIIAWVMLIVMILSLFTVAISVIFS